MRRHPSVTGAAGGSPTDGVDTAVGNRIASSLFEEVCCCHGSTGVPSLIHTPRIMKPPFLQHFHIGV